MVKLFKHILNILVVAVLLLGVAEVAVGLFALWRIFVADRFQIPSGSMFPTFRRGDWVIVDKTLSGARIYESLHFHDGMELRSWRTRGLRRIHRGDILVFNFPKNGGGISFKINFVYAKRCTGVPGDTLRTNYRADTIRDYGPLYVPRKGDVIRIDDMTRDRYGDILAFEGAAPGDSLHQFAHDYYFMAGDNFRHSYDSRFWGFVPEEYIVGIVRGILYGRDPATGARDWKRSRFFKRGWP